MVLTSKLADTEFYGNNFKRIRKTAKRDYLALSCPSARNHSAPTGRIFVKFDMTIFEHLSRKLRFQENQTRITGNLHEDQYTFLIISCSILLRMRSFTQNCRENQNTHFMFNNPPQILPFEMWKTSMSRTDHG